MLELDWVQKLMYQPLKFSLLCNPLLLVLCWISQLAGFDLGSSSFRAFSCMQLKVQQDSFTSRILHHQALYIKVALGPLTVDLKEMWLPVQHAVGGSTAVYV